MNMILLALFVTLGYLMSVFSTVLVSNYMSGRKDRGQQKQNFFEWWLYHARKLNEVKIGETDPWGQYPVLEVTKAEYISAQCTKAVFGLMPVIAGFWIISILVTLFSSITSLIILLWIVGIAAAITVSGAGIYFGGRFLFKLLLSLGTNVENINTAMKAEGEKS